MGASLLALAKSMYYYFLNKVILEGEFKDAKISSFSFDFQALIKH